MAIAAFFAFVLAGVGFLATQDDEPQPRQRAVAGSPGTGGAPAGGMPPGMPPGGAPGQPAMPDSHPNIELPDEVARMLDEMAAEAEAAPEDEALWERLARAHYRASLLNPSYRDAAARALKHLIGINPENLEALRLDGNMAYDERRFEEAEKRFLEFLERDPENAAVITDLGSTRLFRGQLEEAVKDYRRATELDGEFLQAHFNLGIALGRMGMKDESTASLNRAKELTESPQQAERIDQLIAAVQSGAVPPTGNAPGGAPGNPHAKPGAGAPALRPGAPHDMPNDAVHAGARTGGTGHEGHSHPAGSPHGSDASSTVATNATSDFQRDAEALLRAHNIVGPKIVGFHWDEAGSGRAELRGFPMDKMPPVMRNLFKSRVNEKLAGLVASGSDGAPALDDLDLELTDADSGRVMDHLDGKEWVGEFDDPLEGS